MDEAISPGRISTPYFLLCGLVAALTATLVAYSLTYAFAWDEGFHLLTAQLIMRGKTPYLDWCFPQTLLNAYWNALWMRVFGDTWRTAHVVAALMSSGSVMLTVDYVYVRFPVKSWRLAASIACAFLVGLNILVVDYGTIGQAYGFCLFMIVAAFRLTVASAERKSLWLAALAGLFAGAGPAGSLLTTWVCPVLAIYLFLRNGAGNRWWKVAIFAAAAVIPFLPMIWLFILNPDVTRFNVIDYHLLYRMVQWEGAIGHDVNVMIAWIDSGDALMLGLLSIVGLVFVRFQSDWDKRQRSEFYLCGWLALALGAQISSAHPTFTRYFLLTVPFLGILAMAGLYSLTARLYSADRRLLPVLAVALLSTLDLVKTIRDGSDNFHWTDLERLAAKVNEVTPSNGVIFADEQVFFITRRPPPEGMELADSHKLEMAPALAASRHILTGTVLEKQVKAGRFDTIQSCGSDDRVKDWGYDKIYHKQAEIEDCTVFWDK
jgi:4-amino-4-deoxy-L-arabinose transferase-like glycosyltransferase